MNNRTKEYKLFQEMKDISSSGDWEKIKKEWKLKSVYESDEPQTCMCGKYPIMEICVLKNIENGNYAEVGNSCVNKFLGIESGFIIKGIKKIKNNLENSVPKKLIIKSYDENIITKKDYEFYINILRKRNLSFPQQKWKKNINNKILNKYLKK